MQTDYTALFDPESKDVPKAPPARCGDRTDGTIYVFEERITLAVNVALATGRPLLLRGRSGCGKSSLAKSVARRLQRRFYAAVITGRSEADHLLWRFDAIRRLADAQALKAGAALPPAVAYVEPGPLWWAIDPGSAERRGAKALPEGVERAADLSDPGTAGERAVLLIDEIDKADPDFPNGLLVPLGSYAFTVRETGTPVSLRSDAPPLVFITTNDERDLPSAFLRRCIILEIPPAKRDRLVEIGNAHFPEMGAEVLGKIADELERLCKSDKVSLEKPCVAEYLDAVSAFQALGLKEAESKIFQQVARITLRKRPSDHAVEV